MNEQVTNVFCTPWNIPMCQAPTGPVVMNVTVVAARAVLKKLSAVRIPTSLGKSEPVVVQPQSLIDYKTFSTFIKATCKLLDVNQNVIYFSDIDDEHKFLYGIGCFYAALHGKTEIVVLAITLNNDLTNRMVKWEKVSPEVISDLKPPPDPNAKKQSIASMHAISAAERRHKAVEILNEEASMDFRGPILKRTNEETVSSITVWKRYVPLLLSLNSLMFTIDNQFLQIERTVPIDESIVTEICQRVLKEHSVDDDE